MKMKKFLFCFLFVVSLDVQSQEVPGRFYLGLPNWPEIHDIRNLFQMLIPAPVPKTGQITSYGAGDDGDIQAGVSWPNPRFVVSGDDTMVDDNLTGLVWTRNADIYGVVLWSSISDHLQNINNGLHNDWRLPSVNEFLSLMDYGFDNPALSDTDGVGGWTENNSFSNVALGVYWTSTDSLLQNPTGLGLGVNVIDGIVIPQYRANATNHLWFVRDNGDADMFPAPVVEDIQTPRFVDNNDGTATNNLTGLVWLKNTDCINEMRWNTALSFADDFVDGICDLADGSEKGDWRLPNVKEFLSLLVYEGGFPENHPLVDFENYGFFWTSTTRNGDFNWDYAVMINPKNGLMTFGNKTINKAFVLLVKGGFG